MAKCMSLNWLIKKNILLLAESLAAQIQGQLFKTVNNLTVNQYNFSESSNNSRSCSAVTFINHNFVFRIERGASGYLFDLNGLNSKEQSSRCLLEFWFDNLKAKSQEGDACFVKDTVHPYNDWLSRFYPINQTPSTREPFFLHQKLLLIVNNSLWNNIK